MPAVRSSAGVHWPVKPLPRRLGEIDLVMVIGGDGVDAACRDAPLIGWLQRASRSLARGASLAEAALDAGFADQAHLSRSMRRVFGVTPATVAALIGGGRAGSRP
jgi:transcriptional regulator GlxA family with amidase domain